MEASAREFAVHGFHDASLNKILQKAAISKGAAYYYFDDKADLFATTVAFYAEALVANLLPPVEQLKKEDFWPKLRSFYEKQLDYFDDRPWAFGVIKAAGRLSPKAIEAEPLLAQFVAEIEHHLQTIIRRGQKVGVIRTDLPDELLVRLFAAIDDVSDRWLLENWQSLQPEEMRDTLRRILQGLERFMEPPA
jgi:AcrR family transcriptional regulator